MEGSLTPYPSLDFNWTLSLMGHSRIFHRMATT